MAIVFIQSSDPAFISEGASDDRYILSEALLTPGQVITLTDGEGENTLQLEPGLEIISSSTTGNFMVLTLSNGAIIRLTNAENFTFITGATNTVTGTGGNSESFSEFVTNGLGLPSVPTGDLPVSGGGVTVLEGGGTDVTDFDPAESFILSAGGDLVAEGQTVTFSLETTNVDAGTSFDYTITGVSAADIVGPLTGTLVVDAAGEASLTLEIAADQLTEGFETLSLSLDNGATSAEVTVIDTSVSPSNIYISGLGRNGIFSDYNIEVVFSGLFTQSRKEAFMDAADYLSTIIVGDLQDIGSIDDHRIVAHLEEIDGPFGILGFAGPTDLRNSGLLPYEGEMTFDSADISNLEADNTLGDVILHEMLHTLGFGTMWELLGLVTSGSDVRFTGENAISAYNAEFPGIAGADAKSLLGIPIETDGGPGTAGGHWDEETFFNEVMTGFSNSSNYMSSMSIAALEDMGYDTIFDINTPAATVPQLDDFMNFI